MSEIVLEEKKPQEYSSEAVSLKPVKKPVKKVEYQVENKSVSKNIQRFDNRVKFLDKNPYSFNSVSLKKARVSTLPSATAEQMIVNPVYNKVGKVLGVDTVHDWNKYYDKVYTISEWAKKQSNKTSIDGIIRFINSFYRRVPQLGAKEIDNLYMYAKTRL